MIPCVADNHDNQKGAVYKLLEISIYIHNVQTTGQHLDSQCCQEDAGHFPKTAFRVYASQDTD